MASDVRAVAAGHPPTHLQGQIIEHTNRGVHVLLTDGDTHHNFIVGNYHPNHPQTVWLNNSVGPLPLPAWETYLGWLRSIALDPAPPDQPRVDPLPWADRILQL